VSAPVRVAVVGGGITGLAAALRLSERLGGVGFILLEGDDRLGGKIATERAQGYVIEGGPDCFLASKPGGIALCCALGLEPQLRGTNPALRRTYIKRRGRLHELPEGLSGLVPSRIGPLLTSGLLSPLGRARAGVEWLVRARRSAEDESIAAFVTRRFGAEAYHWLVEPLLSGIFAGDGTQLSLEATFPQLAQIEREHGSVVGAMMRSRARRRGPTPPGPGFVTTAGGLGEIVEAIAARLPAATRRMKAAVVAITRTAAGYRLTLASGEELFAENVVLATPAFAAAALLRPLAPELAAELEAIPYVSTATVSLAFLADGVPRPLDGYGYVSPRAEGGPIVACTWTSNKFTGRVPAGGVLIRFFLGRAGQEEIVNADDAALVGVAREELARLLDVTMEPSLTRVFRWPRGMPQYHVGHLARLDRIERLASRLPGLLLAGSAYRGIGVPDCITQGWAAAERALGISRAAA
jgi:oxygen-dependent protoporphyrinogen oxidase